MQTEDKNIFRKAWAGEERLWRVWWGLGIPLAAVANVHGAWLEVSAGSLSPAALVLSLLAFFIIMVAGLIWCYLAWRCAKNVDNTIWTVLAKVSIVAGLILNAYVLIGVIQQL
jgi:hypothetical protein